MEELALMTMRSLGHCPTTGVERNLAPGDPLACPRCFHTQQSEAMGSCSKWGKSTEHSEGALGHRARLTSRPYPTAIPHHPVPLKFASLTVLNAGADGTV